MQSTLMIELVLVQMYESQKHQLHIFLIVHTQDYEYYKKYGYH